ncbi:MAG: cache domain-containing protein [Anaerolineae bacterium]|jgi:HAMP domain-containing protein
MRTWLRSGIFRRLLFSILTVSLMPLIILGAFTLGSVRDAGRVAIARSRAALDEKATQALELRTVETAAAIARFLEEREADLRALALLPRTASAYQAFSQAREGTLWVLEEGVEVREQIPLYTEIAWVNTSGQELIRIDEGQVAAPTDLRDVSDPANTTYRSETYFQEAGQLSPGEIYVSHVTGFYVPQAAFEAGARFRGVLRFAMPVFDSNGSFDGVVVLALDSRHLEEFTTHIVPDQRGSVVAPDPEAGNYAYVIDDLARTIAHPVDHLQWGLDSNGQPLSHATRPEEIGSRPVLLDQLGFIDEDLASIHGRAAQGEAGSIHYFWAGHDKFAAYAPIPYTGGPYEPPAGFGWVGISADVNAFHEAAYLVGAAIEGRVETLGVAGLVILGLTGLAVLLVAGVVARTVATPVRRLTEAAESVRQGEFDLPALDDLTTGRSDDEIAHLARAFRDMASQVEKRETTLREEVRILRIEIDEVQRARDVSRITETETFRQLREEARKFREQDS